MRSEVIAILRRAARKLLLTRSAESAAAAGTAGALAAAAIIMAVTVAQSSQAIALAICALPVAAGLALALSRRLTPALGLDRPCAIWIALVALAAGGGGAAIIISGRCDLLPRTMTAAALTAVAIVGGWLARMVRGVSLEDAAEFLDGRATLNERLATAVYLTQDHPRTGAMARAVFSQALAALHDRRPHKAPMWRRTRAAAAALVLAVLVCAAVALLPGRGGPDVRELAVALGQMSPRQRARIAEALLRAARSADPRLAEALAGAAKLIQVEDADAVAKTIRKLREQGFSLVTVIPAELLVAAGLGGGGGDTAKQAGLRPANGVARHTDDGNIAPAPASDPNARRVLVYDPNYDTPATSALSRPPADALVPYDTAWSAARDRAARALARGNVPARYRPIVRAFFLDKQ